MSITTVSDLRKNLSNYLEKVKISKKPLIFGARHKREYLILPYPDGQSNEDLFEIYENLEDKLIQTEYYKGLENIMSEWNDGEHDNLFVS